jgi:hypothetical protein
MRKPLPLVCVWALCFLSAITLVGLESWGADAKPADAKTDVKTDDKAVEPGATTAPMSKATKKAIEFEKARAERIARIEVVAKELMKEANELDNFDNAAAQAVFTRPHPAVSTLRSEYALDILDRMAKPFTGNEFRDTYIRWHFMFVVKNAPQEEKEKMGERLVALIKTSPGAIEAEERREWYWDPEEIGRKWWELQSSGHRVVGYPPFQREVWPPESYAYMTGDEKAQVEANL